MTKKNILFLLLIFLTIFISSANATLVDDEYGNNSCLNAESYADPGEVIDSWITYPTDQDWSKGYLNKEKDNVCQNYNKEVLK